MHIVLGAYALTTSALSEFRPRASAFLSHEEELSVPTLICSLTHCTFRPETWHTASYCIIMQGKNVIQKDIAMERLVSQPLG